LFGLRTGALQRIGLHVHQHQVHAPRPCDARDLKSKTRAGAGDDGRAASEIGQHGEPLS
jgi:hypothetical protein